MMATVSRKPGTMCRETAPLGASKGLADAIAPDDASLAETVEVQQPGVTLKEPFDQCCHHQTWAVKPMCFAPQAGFTAAAQK